MHAFEKAYTLVNASFIHSIETTSQQKESTDRHDEWTDEIWESNLEKTDIV